MTYQTVAVVGSGIMGSGIAIAAASAGRSVFLSDVSSAVLDEAIRRIDGILASEVRKKKLTTDRKADILAGITPVKELDEIGAAEFVIEAVPERMDIKRDLFARLSAACAPDCVLATNTSSLSVTGIAAAVSHPERLIGTHFFNPAHVMKLVEVVPGRLTSPEIAESVMRFASELGKTPVRVKDTPGFLVNRIARPFYNEALRILEEGGAGIEAVDRIVKGHGFRMGPFELMDLIGNDVNYEVTRSLFEAYHYDARYRPSHIQRALVDAGLLGRKSGRGFYPHGDAPGGKPPEVGEAR